VVVQGYRSLEDLEKDGILNKVQKIGLRHFHDFLERMQREEVEEIEAKVKGKPIVTLPWLSMYYGLS